jgi:hypothetical protein
MGQSHEKLSLLRNDEVVVEGDLKIVDWKRLFLRLRIIY